MNAKGSETRMGSTTPRPSTSTGQQGPMLLTPDWVRPSESPEAPREGSAHPHGCFLKRGEPSTSFPGTEPESGIVSDSPHPGDTHQTAQHCLSHHALVPSAAGTQ